MIEAMARKRGGGTVMVGSKADSACLLSSVPSELIELVESQPQRAFPAIAKDSVACNIIRQATGTLPSAHQLFCYDSRALDLEQNSIELVLTSPPYWTLKKYNDTDGQLGEVEDYDEFLDQLDEVWTHCYDALVPGGRMVIVVGDVNVSRKAFGRHLVFPLHASIQERCRQIGFDNLAPIIWYKITNGRYEMGSGGFYGKPYEPNGVIKNDIEYILFQRKPGGYRTPDLITRLLSVLSAEEHSEWFQQIWKIGGASTRDHPAPYPLALAERLIRMFSFVGDTVFDPFLGTGTTSVVAAECGRNSVGCEIDPDYFAFAVDRIRRASESTQQVALQPTA